ncbi:MAG: AbrB/MazE/SpoVT family DNA-binding domain-containing protein [Boseongicola sp. SB0677_bin_26]|nr:AbrB/MazE/SpoVT family DNA-binding domain-containing protein [Boseongicola sp. SB0677_bin_26]
MIESAVTSKGQTTLPRAVRDALGLEPGDRVRYIIFDSNEVRILPVRPLARLFGAFKHDGPPVTLDDMERAADEGAVDR